MELEESYGQIGQLTDHIGDGQETLSQSKQHETKRVQVVNLAHEPVKIGSQHVGRVMVFFQAGRLVHLSMNLLQHLQISRPFRAHRRSVVVVDQVGGQVVQDLLVVIRVDLIAHGSVDHVEQVIIERVERQQVPKQPGQVEEEGLNAEEEDDPLVIAQQLFVTCFDGQQVQVVRLAHVEGAFEPAVVLHVLLVSLELGRYPAVDGTGEEALERAQNDGNHDELGRMPVEEAIGEEVIVAGRSL